jgi:hypothetical protein
MKHGTDMLNGAWGYPNGTTAQRTAIREAHIQYILGLLWFWQTDPSTGDALHQELSALGFCTDEYVGDSGYANDPPHWPYQLYVREARRMVGDYVWTEAVISDAMQKRSVGLGAYSFDCHWVTLYVEHNATNGDGEAKPYIAAEGRKETRLFAMPLIYKNDHLPRQARDKYRENSKKDAFLQE